MTFTALIYFAICAQCAGMPEEVHTLEPSTVIGLDQHWDAFDCWKEAQKYMREHERATRATCISGYFDRSGATIRK